jgi:hypothetical protein
MVFNFLLPEKLYKQKSTREGIYFSTKKINRELKAFFFILRRNKISHTSVLKTTFSLKTFNFGKPGIDF